MSTHNQVIDRPGPNSEAILFHQAQAGCRLSLNGLMAKHEGLVQAVVRRQCLSELPFDEALQSFSASGGGGEPVPSSERSSLDLGSKHRPSRPASFG